MAINRRRFISASVAGGLAASLPLSACSSEANIDNYLKIDEAFKRPVLRTNLFSSPVIIESLELLKYKKNFICRVRSTDGIEGFAFAHGGLDTLYPVFLNRLQPFFIGKNALDLEALLDEVYVYQSNYKLQSVALWVPLATIEFAILDMLGRMANLPMGLLISDKIYNPEINLYQANSERYITPEETIDHLKQQLEKSQAKALKFKLGGRMSHPEIPVGRSEKLIPLARKTFGDEMFICADSNGSYDVAEAIKIGKIMQEHNYAFYEEPVPFDWYEETKQVADALSIPISGGEQEPSMRNFRWLIANDALQIVQADMFYFGGLIRSVKVARMAHALGKTHVPHVSGIGYVYTLHFVSAIPNAGPYHELKTPFNKDMSFECDSSSLLPNEGVVKVPTGPGMGIVFDPDFIDKHEVIKA